jgi:hypothetical protein
LDKTSINRKTLIPLIDAARDSGKTDQEIYFDLTDKYYDKKGVALLITGTATRENKEKFKGLNNLLVGLLGSSIILKVLMILTMSIVAGEAWFLVLVFIAPLFSGYFMYEIAKYNGPVYRLCGIITIATFMQSIEHLNNATDTVLNVAFVAAIAGLSFYLDSKLFPDYSPRDLQKEVMVPKIVGDYLRDSF